MTLPIIDDGPATSAAAEAKTALAVGDTPRARDKCREAAAHLERRILSTTKQEEKHFFRFLAATQYYLGGDYSRARDLCQRIDQRLLPLEVRNLFPPFFRDVKSRAGADYRQKTRRTLLSLWKRRDRQRLLAMLQDHPYVLPPGSMAFMRAVICEDDDTRDDDPKHNKEDDT